MTGKCTNQCISLFFRLYIFGCVFLTVGERFTARFFSFERPVYLNLKKHRFYFKACQQTFITKTPYIQPRSTISNKVKRLMTRKLTKFTSEKDVAKSLCVSPSTVHCHLKEVSNL